eukprot:c18935_g1_i1 orf=710-1432(-)
MGNCPCSCMSNSLVYNAGEETVKVIRKSDGKLFEYEGPVYVKDLLSSFNGLSIFHSSTDSRPLCPETELKLGEVYYLQPSQLQNEDIPDKGPDLNSLHSSLKDGELKDADKPINQSELDVKANKRSRRVRFWDDESASKAQVPPCPSADSPKEPKVEILTHQQNGIFRVKLLISRKQLTEILSTDAKAEALAEKLIGPLLAVKVATETKSSESLNEINLKPWKPSLETIPEVSSERFVEL